MKPEIKIVNDNEIPALDRKRDLKNKFGITLTAFSEIEDIPHKKNLVRNFLGAGEMSCLFGPPGSAKSVLAGDLAAHCAWGQDWFGRRTMQGGVLFIAAERAALVKRRFAAFRLYYGLADLPLAVLSGSLDFRSNGTAADGIIEYAKRWKDDDGTETRLIIGDTVSRLIAGGDENSPKDVGAFINNVARIQDATGAHILLIHHVPHEQNRMRGHGALLAACDTTIKIEKCGDIRTATVEKNNDGEEGEAVAFKLESQELGKDPDTGQMTTAPVVRPTDQPTYSADKPKLSKNQTTMFSLLHEAGPSGLTVEQWYDQAREAGLGISRKADLTDFRTTLKAKGLVHPYGDRWTVNH
jgi:hypothetical protein